MHSFQCKSAIFHYDGGLDGNIIIVDNNKNEVRLDANDLVRLFVKEGLLIPKNPNILVEVLSKDQKEIIKRIGAGHIKIESCHRNEEEFDIYLIAKSLEDYNLVEDKLGINEYKLTSLGYDVLKLLKGNI